MTSYLYIKRAITLCFFLFTILSNYGQNIVVTSAVNNTSVSTCNSFIIDSGNQGGPGYSNNENVTFTLCPATAGQAISLSFGLFNLDLTDDNASTTVTNVDYLKIFDGNSTAAPLMGTYTGNSLQGAVIVGNSSNTSGCLTIQFYSNMLGTGKFAFSASCDTPCSNPVANAKITSGLTNDSIKVCMGETVGFENFGSFAQTGFTLTNYTWDFMDGTTATGQNASHSFSVPGQYRVQLRVTDDNGCHNNNLTDLKVYVGTAPNFDPFPVDSTICIGQQLDLTATPNDYEVLWDGFNQSNTITDGCLTDNLLGTPQNVEVNVSGFIPGVTITDVNQIQSMCIGIEHSFIGDIVITIKCPTGQSLILHQQGGGGTELGVPVELDNVDCNDPATIGEPGNYCFTPAATQTWVDYVNNNNFPSSIPNGDYAPIGSFNDLLGCPANGVWTLTVVDNWAADDGTLFSFGINLSPDLYQDLITFQPQIGLAADSSYWLQTGTGIVGISGDKDVLTVKPTSPGNYSYTYVVKDDFGCTYDTTITITVAPNPSLNAGNDTLVCAGNPIDLNGVLGAGGMGTCSYVLQMDDTFGDGWNGNNLIFTVNGVQTSYTLATGSSETVTLNFPSGSSVSYSFDGLGSFVSECSFTITGTGVNVTQGPGLMGSVNGTFSANCVPPYVVNWTPANVFGDPSQFSTTASVPGTTMLTLSVYPIGFPECVFSDSLLVNVSSQTYAGIDTTVNICSDGQPVDLFDYLGNGVTTGGVWKSSPANTTVTMPYAPQTWNEGVYNYIVTGGACVDTATVTVDEIIPIITNQVIEDVSCNGLTDGLISFQSTNVVGYTIDGVSIVASSPFLIDSLAPGEYELEVTTIEGCTNTQTITITEPQPIQIVSTTPDTTICDNGNVLLTVTATGGNGVYAYSWSNGQSIVGQAQTLNVTPTATTTYCVTVSEACGNSNATECLIVTVPTMIFPQLIPDIEEGCIPLTVTFSNGTNSPNVQSTTVIYDGVNQQTQLTLSPFQFTYTESGVFDVYISVTSTFGCVYDTLYSNFITVFQGPQSDFVISPEHVSMFTPNTHLLLTNPIDTLSYTWIIPNGSPNTSSSDIVSVSYPEDQPNVYPVSLVTMTQDGCRDTTIHYVYVDSDVLLYVPNTFTPDGDQFNQTWKISILGASTDRFEWNVFNRWGQQVWSSNSPTDGWDGTVDGKLAQGGLYTWRITCRDAYNDKKREFTGFVQILK